MNNSISRWALIIISIAGVLIMGYLTSLHYAQGEGSFCDIGEGLSCSAVNQSIYSEVFGIPVSVMGLIYFFLVLVVSVFFHNEKNSKYILLASTLFVGPSIYLSYIELFVINEVCIFCELSKILILAVIVSSAFGVSKKKIIKNTIIVGLIGALILAGILHLVFNSGGPGDKYNEFATCLYEKGLRMYGSAGCSFCAKQRAIFGDAIENIHEIECDPRFPNAQYELCIEKDIAHTPTWILEDGNGNTVERLEDGVKKLEELAEVTGCQLPEDRN
jgi:uncharacterized membrane protein